MRSVKLLGIIMLLVFSFNIVAVFAEVQMTDYASVINPCEIVWTGKKFLVASNEDNATKLYSINPQTKTIERFASTFAGVSEVHFVSSSGAEFPREYVYASAGRTISEISPLGDTVRVFVTLGTDSEIAGLAFDNRGYWNYNLLAVAYDGSVWEINKLGSATNIANVGAGVSTGGVVVARDEYGDFSGNLLVSMVNKTVLSVDHKEHKVAVLATLPEIPGLIMYTPSSNDLYLAKASSGKIVQLDRDFLQDYLAQILVISTNSDGKSTSLFSIKSARAGVNVTKIATINESDIVGATFVNDNELNAAIQGIIDEETTDLNPLIIIIPILVAVIIVVAFVLYKYRGF